MCQGVPSCLIIDCENTRFVNNKDIDSGARPAEETKILSHHFPNRA